MKCDKVNKNLVFPAIFLCMLLIGSCARSRRRQFTRFPYPAIIRLYGWLLMAIHPR